MALKRFILYAILGPLLLWSLFMGHLACRVLFQTAEPISVRDFPEGTTQKVRDNVIERRKTLLKDTTDMYRGLRTDEWVQHWCAVEEIQFEDPLQRYEGEREVRMALNAYMRYLVSNEVTVKGVTHGQSEVVIDWEMTLTMKFLPTFTMPLRTHLLLHRPTKISGYEKIWRIYEEWYGNKLLTESTTMGFLGRMHQNMRRFIGVTMIKLIDAGYL